MKLELERFWAWLRTLPANEFCGMRRSVTRCPLAQYLETQTGVCYSVSDGYGPYEQPYAVVPDEPLPPWAEWFMALVDDGGPIYEPVLAQEGLAYLEEIGAGTKRR